MKRGGVSCAMPLDQHVKQTCDDLLRNSKTLLATSEAKIERVKQRIAMCNARRTIRQRNDLIRYLEKLESSATRLRDGSHIREFDQQAQPFMEAYTRNVGCTKRRCVESNGGASTSNACRPHDTNTSAASASNIVSEYLARVAGEVPRTKLERSDLCGVCSVPMILVPARAILVCPQCARSTTFIDATSSSVSYDETFDCTQHRHEPTDPTIQCVLCLTIAPCSVCVLFPLQSWRIATKDATISQTVISPPCNLVLLKPSASHTYLTLVTLHRDRDATPQGLEAFEVSQHIVDECMQELYKQRVISLDQITTQRIRLILKSLKERRCYEHAPQIVSRITGRKSLQLPAQASEVLRLMFTAVQLPFSQAAPSSRKNLCAAKRTRTRTPQIPLCALCSHFPVVFVSAVYPIHTSSQKCCTFLDMTSYATR